MIGMGLYLEGAETTESTEQKEKRRWGTAFQALKVGGMREWRDLGLDEGG
jgi:hypothetical protein